VRVEPEHMLEQNWVATNSGIKDTDMQCALNQYQTKRYSYNRCTQNDDDAGCVVRPYIQRKPRPGHARSTHLVNGRDKVDPRKDGGEPCKKRREDRKNDVSITIGTTIGRVERPPCLHSTKHQY